MGGKTGTAQVVRIGERRLKKHEMAYLHRDHAWFAAYGIKDGKTYAAVVMVEHGGGGGAVAGPIMAKVFQARVGPVPEEAKHLPPLPSPFMPSQPGLTSNQP
jgi:penicillin-binding protein 2